MLIIQSARPCTKNIQIGSIESLSAKRKRYKKIYWGFSRESQLMVVTYSHEWAMRHLSIEIWNTAKKKTDHTINHKKK